MSEVETIRVVGEYGPLTRGVDYPVIEHGYDYLLVKARGGVTYLPKHMVQTEWDRRKEERELRLRDEREEEDYYE